MVIVDDDETARWLDGLMRMDSVGLEWDAGNRTKNRKHDVEPDDVVAIFAGRAVFAGRIVSPASEEPRWLLLGEDDAGRLLTLVFTRRGERLRPMSCRPMRREERRVYEGSSNEEEDDGGED